MQLLTYQVTTNRMFHLGQLNLHELSEFPGLCSLLQVSCSPEIAFKKEYTGSSNSFMACRLRGVKNGVSIR